MAEQSSLFPEGLARSQLDLLAELAAEGAGLEPAELRSRSQQHVVRTRAEYQRNRLVSRLFQSLLKERVPPSDFTRAEKQTAVASRRIGQQVQEEAQRRQAEQAKKRGPTLFDMDEVT